MKTKAITQEQLKDTLRYVFGALWHKTDLTNYDNWVGFTHFCEDVWDNLDKRKNRRRKGDFRRCPAKPPSYRKFISLPFIGTLYVPETNNDSTPAPSPSQEAL